MTNRPIDRAPQPKRHVGPYYGHGLRRVIEPDVTDPGFIERLTDYWAELAESTHFWRVLAVGILLSLFAAGLIVVVA